VIRAQWDYHRTSKEEAPAKPTVTDKMMTSAVAAVRRHAVNKGDYHGKKEGVATKAQAYVEESLG
jgi:hypothetical protein